MEVLTKEVLQARVPSIFETSSYGMSEKYNKINTYSIIEGMQNNGFFPVLANQARTTKDEKKSFARHIVRFRHVHDLETTSAQCPEIVLMNSHDGSSAYRMLYGIFRVVCANGMIVSDSMVSGINIRHSGRYDILGRVLTSAHDLAGKASIVNTAIESWKTRILSNEEKLRYAQGAFDQWKAGRDIKINPWSLLQARRYSDAKNDDLWTVFNNVQENFTKGGFRVQNANGHVRRATKLSAIDKDVKMNSLLWDYTAKFNQN